MWNSAGELGNSGTKTFIALMNNPWTIDGEPVLLAEPEYDWETHGTVTEGPAALQSHGATFVFYSGSSAGPDNCVGVVYNEDGDFLNPDSWTKMEEPILSKSSTILGPGHNGIFQSPDGTEDWIVYHARESAGDTNRWCWAAQKLEWDDYGLPMAITPAPWGTVMDAPSGEPLETIDSNTAPTAEDVAITGAGKVGALLTGVYRFVDQDGEEGALAYRWLIADDEHGDYEAIPEATDRTFVPTEEMAEKFIRFEVTPADEHRLAGKAVMSDAAVKIESAGPGGGDPELNRSELAMKVGDTAVLSVQNTTPGAIISWSSSDESVAAVDKGKVTALAAGSATITADVDGMGLTCEVTVRDAGEEKKPSLNKTSLSLKVGASERLKVQNLPDGVEEKDIVWTSENEKIATVSDTGLLKAVAVGKTTVSADVNGITLTCEVTVTQKSSGGSSGSSSNSSGRVITVTPAPGTPGGSGPSGNHVSVKTEDGKPVVISTSKSGTSPLTAEQAAAMASAGTLNRTVNPDGAWNGRTTGKNNVALVIDTSTAQLQPGNSHQLGISTFVGDGSQKLRVRASREGFVSITPNPDGTYTITADKPVADLYILVEILDANGSVIGHSSMKLNAAAGLTPNRVENRAATIA